MHTRTPNKLTTLTQPISFFRRHAPTLTSPSSTSTPSTTQPSRTQSSKRSLTPRAQPARHTSLDTFLAHARTTGLDPRTRVFQGTVYEYVVQSSLARLGVELARRGGRGDRGVDLGGTWFLPRPSSADRGDACADDGKQGPATKWHGRQAQPLRVFVQCKALARGAGPHLVREMEGAYSSFASSLGTKFPPSPSPSSTAHYGDTEAKGTIGILTTQTPATKGVLDALRTSRIPLAFAMVSARGTVRQLVFNARAGALAPLRGVQVETRYVAGCTGLSRVVQSVRRWAAEVRAREGVSSAGGRREGAAQDLGSGIADEGEGDEGEEEKDMDELHREVILTRDGASWDFPVSVLDDDG